jgi:hypothetical protein
MPRKSAAAPSGNSGAAGAHNVVELKVYATPPPARAGRSRYLRLFPERVAFLLLHLDARELTGYLRIATHYVVADGQLPADDKALARIAAMPAKVWADLRARLIDLGIVHVEGDRLVDADQQANLDIQRAASARQRARVMRRWGKS